MPLSNVDHLCDTLNEYVWKHVHSVCTGILAPGSGMSLVGVRIFARFGPFFSVSPSSDMPLVMVFAMENDVICDNTTGVNIESASSVYMMYKLRLAIHTSLPAQPPHVQTMPIRDPHQQHSQKKCVVHEDTFFVRNVGAGGTRHILNVVFVDADAADVDRGSSSTAVRPIAESFAGSIVRPFAMKRPLPQSTLTAVLNIQNR